ncbi:hypothetical protein AMECASPLE_028261 [Ameca splendens]|uniref:Uncharacterized protein n=1 Tax=Ameca splendens TaxID=208324 RepID=A0ABV0Y587_9TELE
MERFFEWSRILQSSLSFVGAEKPHPNALLQLSLSKTNQLSYKQSKSKKLEMFSFRKSRRVGPLAKNSSGAVSFLSPLTTATPDPADMIVAGQLNRSPTNFDELLPSTSRSETRNHLDLLKWIFTKLKPRRKPFKSAQKHCQEAEPEPDVETEQTDPKAVHTPLDPSSVWPSILDHSEEFDYKSVSTLAFSIPSKEEQQSSLASFFTEETSFDEIEVLSVDTDDWISTFAAERSSSDTEETAEKSTNAAIKSCIKDFFEMQPDETSENVEEQEKYGSCQTKDSNQTGNTVMEDKLLGPLESHVGSVETLKGITNTPGSYRIIQLKKDIFFFDMDSSKNKQQSNADPVVDAEKSYISGDTDTESMLPSYRISAKSAVTDEQSENTQVEDQDDFSCPEHISAKTLGSFAEDLSHSDLLLDPRESPCQANTEGPPNQARKSPKELSFEHLSNNFERRVYRRCLEIYQNAFLHQWSEMNPRSSSQSATENLTEPPTSSTECWTETVPEKLSSQPESPPRNVGSTRSRFKIFRNLVWKRLSRLFKMRIVVTVYL